MTGALNQLAGIFGKRMQRNESIRRQHTNTLTWLASELPTAVLFPQTTAEVVAAVKIADEHGVPIVPFGAGTSLEGQVNAPLGGISIDFSRMDQVIAVNAEDMDCTVEAGVPRGRLNEYLRDTGLFFPVDPGTEEATLGGMAATRASGTCAVRYGTMRENVLNITAVMADGSVIQTANRARKSSAGYDLTRLLVGSEGTLGIITELTVRLYGIPEHTASAVVPFANLKGACRATATAIQLGLGVARVELLDPLQIAALNKHSGSTIQEKPTLFLDFHGTRAAVAEQIESFESLARDEGATGFEKAETVDERNKLWRARHDALWATKETWPGKSVLVTDVCVPVSRLAECVAETQREIDDLGLIAPIVGHVGDGNFHVLVLFDASDAGELAVMKDFSNRLARRAVSMDGTCTGEHGIGEGKIDMLEHELGSAVETMRLVKRALDPKNILNPGKIMRL